MDEHKPNVCPILQRKHDHPTLDLPCGKACTHCCKVVGEGKPRKDCRTISIVNAVKGIDIDMGPETQKSFDTLLQTTLENQAKVEALIQNHGSIAAKQKELSRKTTSNDEELRKLDKRVQTCEMQIGNNSEDFGTKIKNVIRDFDHKLKNVITSFAPIKLLVYGFTALLLIAVIGAIVKAAFGEN